MGGFDDRRMLHRGDDDARALRTRCEPSPLHREVVRLGAAGGEDHFRRLGAEKPRHFLPRFIEVPARVSAKGVNRIRVAQFAGNAQELFARLRAKRSSCRMVKIGPSHPHSVVLPAAFWVCRRPQLPPDEGQASARRAHRTYYCHAFKRKPRPRT